MRSLLWTAWAELGKGVPCPAGLFGFLCPSLFLCATFSHNQTPSSSLTGSNSNASACQACSLLVGPGATALWQPHLPDSAASHRRDSHNVILHVGAGGLARATAKPGPRVQRCRDTRSHTVHHWWGQGHLCQAHRDVIRPLVSSAVLKAEIPATCTLPVLLLWPGGRQLWPAGAGSACPRGPKQPQRSPRAPLVPALPPREVPAAQRRVRVLPGCL